MSRLDITAPNETPFEACAEDQESLDVSRLSEDLFTWLCQLGDTTLILSHRLSEWCGHAPVLEEDIAIANTALDLLGHTQLWLSLAGEIEGKGRSADDLAYLRDAMKFRNFLIVELPKDDMAHTTMRQFLFDAWYHAVLSQLVKSRHQKIREIAEKAIKEVSYHLERSSDLVVRLGDGSEESHRRMRSALETLWPYIDELFETGEIDETLSKAGVTHDPAIARQVWESQIADILSEATLKQPPHNPHPKTGGRIGRHTEHLGYILAEMQFLQRAYPGANW